MSGQPSNAKILSKIQQDLKVSKERYNEFGRYNYRSADDILIALKPLLAPHKWLTGSKDRVETRGQHNYQVSTVRLYDDMGNVVAESEAWAREDEDRKKMDAPQLSGSAASYATKRAWGNLLGIDDTKDSDATNIHDGVNASVPPMIKEKEPLRYTVAEFANTALHTEIQKKFIAMESRQEKVDFLYHMISYIDELKKNKKKPDYSTAKLKALDDYCKLYLTAIHNQEHNKILLKAETTGMTPEAVIAELERLKMKPKVVKQLNLEPETKEERDKPKTGVDTSYI